MGPLRILVADDEAGMRHSIARALSNFVVRVPEVDGDVHFQVEGATSGEEALARIAAETPDMLLLDYKMGGMSGLEVLEQLVRQQRGILTIMITAFATIDTAVRATKSGAFDFIAKPFTPEELRETVRKASEHLLAQRQARKLAEERRRVRFEFISVLGHELKSPLGAIESYLAILEKQSLGPELGAYTEIIARSAVRAAGMRKLIEDLLDMTRIESGVKKRELTDLDLVAVARTAIETVQPQAASRNITIRLHAAAAVIFAADRGEMEIIFNNLVSNAVKYNRDGGQVDVTLQADAERLTITVADTGIGLTPEEAGKLFKDFVRIKNEKTRNILGSGLGLAVVQKIARMYDGDVVVSSRPGMGSTFTVTLPCKAPAEAQGHGPQQPRAVAARS